MYMYIIGKRKFFFSSFCCWTFLFGALHQLFNLGILFRWILFFSSSRGKNFFREIFVCMWLKSISFNSKLFEILQAFFSNRLFGEICSLNIIISFTNMSNSCWKVIAVWLQMTIFLRWIEWNCYVSFWTFGCGGAAHKGVTERFSWIRNDRE